MIIRSLFSVCLAGLVGLVAVQAVAGQNRLIAHAVRGVDAVPEVLDASWPNASAIPLLPSAGSPTPPGCAMPARSVSSVDFGSHPVGSTGVVLAIRVLNVDAPGWVTQMPGGVINAHAVIQGEGFLPAGGVVPSTNNGNCFVQFIAFAPSSPGRQHGTLTFLDGSTPVASVTLTGIGIGPNGSTQAPAPAGTPAPAKTFASPSQPVPAPTTTPSPSSALPNRPAECSERYLIIGARGSGDPLHGDSGTTKYGQVVSGMGSAGRAFTVVFTNLFPAGQVMSQPLNYPAIGLTGGWRDKTNAAGAAFHIGPLGAYNSSVNDGKRLLRQVITSEAQICPKVKLLLVGYSQGAQVAADVYQALTPDARKRIAGVVLFGDPYFNGSDTTADRGNYDSHRHGALGQRPTYAPDTNGRVLSDCHGYDPICQGLLYKHGVGLNMIALWDVAAHFTYEIDWPAVAAKYLAARLG